MSIVKPSVHEYAPYYHTYIGKVEGNDLIPALSNSAKNFIDFLEGIPQHKHDHKYAEGKWTIKEVVAHIIDCERVFAYRALTFSRNDKTDLPGFDENAWAPQTNTANRTMASLIEEYRNLRAADILMFENMTEEMSQRAGRANGQPISVRALGYILAGHEMHHMTVIKERYLL